MGDWLFTDQADDAVDIAASCDKPVDLYFRRTDGMFVFRWPELVDPDTDTVLWAGKGGWTSAGLVVIFRRLQPYLRP